LTTESERAYVSQETSKALKNMIDIAKTNPDIIAIQNQFDKLTPEQQKEI
jgi:hypothetical protein